MRITHIAVEGVGRFAGRAEIVGLGPGVNILAESNEAGKSTLFRALRACLFKSHTSRDRDEVGLLACEGLSLPVRIEIGFEHEGADYLVRKSFVRSQSASLMRGGVEIARGRAADEALWDLLGIRPLNAQTVDQAAFGVLWVAQGRSFELPSPSGEAASALKQMIDREVGELVGGERARTVLASLDDDLAKLVTGRGPKAGGPLAVALGEQKDIAERLAQAEEQQRVLETQLDALAQQRRALAREGSPQIALDLRADLQAAETALAEGQKAKSELAPHEAAVRQARLLLDRATQDVKALNARATKIDGARAREADIVAEMAPLAEKAASAQAAIDKATAASGECETAVSRLEAEEELLRQLEDAVSRAADRARLVERVAALEDLGRRLAANTATLATNLATAKLIGQVDAALREEDACTARLEAAAPLVDITLGPTGAGVVLVNGVVSESGKRLAIEPLEIRISDLATIRVAAPAESLAADRERQHAIRESIAGLLRSAGAADVPALRQAHAARQQAERDQAGLQAELKVHGIREKTPALAIEQLHGAIAQADAATGKVLAAAGLATLPALDALERQRADIRERRAAAEAQRQSIRNTIETQRVPLADATGRLHRHTGTLAELRKTLADELLHLPDDRRAALLARVEDARRQAREDYETKAAALERQRRDAPSDEELERRQNRLDSRRLALKNHEDSVARLKLEIARLEGQIQSAGGDGIGETVAALREEAELAGREVERQQRRLASLQLLRQMIDAAYGEQRERLQAPLRRHLRPYLNDVFPASDIDFGEDFTVSGLRRGSPAAEAFRQLSDGTQEQIAVLVRLAMGAMLGESGREVPIILDDALVFSDDERIEQMFDALIRAGRRQQVIVLTCRTRAFKQLGGNMLRIQTTESGGT